jgi:hypothetical protein
VSSRSASDSSIDATPAASHSRSPLPLSRQPAPAIFAAVSETMILPVVPGRTTTLLTSALRAV